MTCIVKTPGHWWVGSLGGLVRLDETTLEPQRVYGPADGLAGTRVTALAVEGDVLWVGTDGGVSRLNTKTGEIRTTYAKGYEWRFEFDKSDQCLWALSNYMVIRFDKNSDRPRVFSPSERYSSVVRDGKTLWAMTYDDSREYRLTCLNTATGVKKTTTVKLGELWGSVPLSVAKDDLWVLVQGLGLRQGSQLFRIDKNSLDAVFQDATTGLPHKYVQELTIAGADVWACTTGDYNNDAHVGIGGRLCRYRPDSKRWETLPSISGARHDEPTCVRELDGNIWVATRAYDAMKKMVIGWSKSPVEGESPELKALALNRFDAAHKKWETFLIAPGTNYDRIIAIALQGKRLWFLLERTPLAQSFEELGPTTRKWCAIAGYIDTDQPRSQPVFFEKSPLPPRRRSQWRPEETIDLRKVDETVWVEHADELYRLTEKQQCNKLEFPSPLAHTHATRVFTVEGNAYASNAVANLRFDSQEHRWVDWGITSPWTVSEIFKDSRGTWWLSATMGRISLPADSERNNEDRKPLQAGLFCSQDGIAWQAPNIAPWTWQQADVEGEVRFLSLEEVKRTPRDLDLWGKTAMDGPRVGGRRESQAKMSEGISCLQSDGQRVWVGTLDQGVWCLENNRWRPLWPKSDGKKSYFVPRAGQDMVASMALDGDSLWIATLAHLSRYRISQRSVKKIDDDLIRFKPLGDVSYIEALGMVYFAPMVAKANQRIWYSPLYGFEKGNPTGIFSLGEDRRNWRCAVPGVHGRCFAGSGNFVWIGTPTGLLRYNTKTDQWTRFTTRDGLMANEVTSVAVDDRSIWVGTTSGISRLDRAVFERP